MKPLIRKSLIGASALLLLAGVAQTTVYALPPTADRIIERAETFRGELNLNTAQAALWTQAMGLTKSAFADSRTLRSSLKTDLSTRLSRPDAEPRAFLLQLDAERQAMEPKRRETMNAWLAFYEALDAQQKTAVNQQLAGKLEQLDRLRERFADRFVGGFRT